MAKQLTVCTRIVVFLLGASFVLALSVSSLRASRSSHLPLGAVKWDAITLSKWPDLPKDKTCCYLIDRESSRCDVVPFPSDDQWTQLSVSPWYDAEGNTEGVCRSFGSSSTRLKQSSWGLVRIRLPEGEIIDEVKLDFLPEGRACWVPAHPGRILFAAGDSELYLYDFPGWSSNPSQPVSEPPEGSNETALCRVTWQDSPPCGSKVFITDPVWPSHPLFRHLAFATFLAQLNESNGADAEVTDLLWLLMSDEGDVVKASGLLAIPTTNAPGDRMMFRRFPNVEVGRDGTIRLAYLERVQGQRSIRLEVVPIEIDPETGHPRVPAHSVTRTLDEDCALFPPLFSADGMSVYMVSRNSGQIMKRQIQP